VYSLQCLVCHINFFKTGDTKRAFAKKIVELLIKHKANITLEVNEITALLNGAIAGHLDIIKILIQHANLQFNDRMMAQAVWGAICHGHLDILKYLLSMGASLDVSACAVSMLNWAIRKGHILIVRFLVEECHQNVTMPDKTGLMALDNANMREENLFNVHSQKILTYLLEQVESQDRYLKCPH
jgi:ankyrin repeat protein